MTERDKLLYLLGQIKAAIEGLCYAASNDFSTNVFELLADFEISFNKEIKKILNINN